MDNTETQEVKTEPKVAKKPRRAKARVVRRKTKKPRARRRVARKAKPRSPAARGPFHALLERVRYKGVKPGNPPVSIGVLAKRCKVSRETLHRLMRGDGGARPFIVQRLAAGLHVSERAVQATLKNGS